MAEIILLAAAQGFGATLGVVLFVFFVFVLIAASGALFEWGDV